MSESNVRVVGRYALYTAIAAGGMATVHLGRLLGPVGFSRTVAIKRLHAQFASDPEFVSMFLDEARLAARIRHPNVVPTIDVVATSGELFLVMDYVPGESVARLMRVLRERQQTIPLRILSAVMAGALHGLHAAHEAKDERGHPLGIVHRDVSPQNVLLGTDGSPRVLDFGVAKAAGRVQTTREGQIKGKLSYMPPEQLRGAAVNRQTDIYAAGVMLWELITGQRLFTGDNEGAVVAKVLEGRVEAPSRVLLRGLRSTTLAEPMIRQLESLDATILKALAMQPEARHATAREMAIEIERKLPPATASECADWLESIARDVLASRAAMIAEIESGASSSVDESHVMSVLNAKATLGPSSARFREAVAVGSAPSGRPSSPSFGHPPPSGAVVHPHTLQLPPARYPVAVEGPPVTSPSSISVAGTPRTSHAPNNGARNAIAAVVGVLIGATFLGSALLYRHKRPIADAAPAVLPPADSSERQPQPPPPPSAQPSASIELDTSPPDAGHITKPPPVAPVPQPTPPPKKSPVAPQPQAQPTKPPPATQPDGCDPPYWYDNQNVKRYKPHCFGDKR